MRAEQGWIDGQGFQRRWADDAPPRNEQPAYRSKHEEAIHGAGTIVPEGRDNEGMALLRSKIAHNQRDSSANSLPVNDFTWMLYQNVMVSKPRQVVTEANINLASMNAGLSEAQKTDILKCIFEVTKERQGPRSPPQTPEPPRRSRRRGPP